MNTKNNVNAKLDVRISIELKDKLKIESTEANLPYSDLVRLKLSKPINFSYISRESLCYLQDTMTYINRAKFEIISGDRKCAQEYLDKAEGSIKNYVNTQNIR